MSTQLRVLFLDDDPARREQFLSESRLTESLIWFACNAAEAVYELGHGRFDVAFLDHDLGDFDIRGERLALGCPNTATGHDVAKFIAAMPPAERPALVVVHSWNPCGARRIADTLLDAGVAVRICPFRAGLWEVAR